MGANVTIVGGASPAGLSGHLRLTFEPGSAIADAAAITLLVARCAAKFDRSQALRIANIAKYEGSYAHF